MFIQKDNPAAGDFSAANSDEPASPSKRRRGRPRGLTAQGAEMRRRLYESALSLMAEKGYADTTLRGIAAHAGVSPGLIYRYFPSKRAIVLALYESLSADFVAEARLPRALWRTRFLRALNTSLEVLGPHRATLRELIPVLVSTAEDGIFAPQTAFSRERVSGVFVAAVRGARDAPKPELAERLGRLLYVLHLAILLTWLLDRSPGARATRGIVRVIERILPLAATALRVPGIPRLVRGVDALLQEALTGKVA